MNPASRASSIPIGIECDWIPTHMALNSVWSPTSLTDFVSAGITLCMLYHHVLVYLFCIVGIC